jgi:hypothetical protein
MKERANLSVSLQKLRHDLMVIRGCVNAPLVTDDMTIDREFLATLLGFADDALAALRIVRSEVAHTSQRQQRGGRP